MKENEDEHEFVCLALVRMRSCPWFVKQAGNSSAARQQRNFDQKSSARRSDLQRSVMFFRHVESLQDVFFVQFVIFILQYRGCNTYFFFSFLSF